MADAPPAAAKPAAPTATPQRALKKAAAARIVKRKAAAAASVAQLTLYHVLPRAAPGAPSGGQALLRAEEDRRRYEEQVGRREEDEAPAERDLRRETADETRAARSRDAQTVATREARAQAERDVADAHVRPASAVAPIIAFNPYATNVPPLALTHIEDPRTTERQERIWKEVAESRWRWPLSEERRISFQELLCREHYIFNQCEYLRASWQKVLSWQGNYGRLYKLLTHPITSAYRAQEMADMEAACAAAQISRRFKPSRANPSGKVIYARPKDKFYTSTVKSIEGTFYSHLDQMNQIGDCDMFLLTIIPRPGIANGSLAAAWLEVPRELSVIYEALKSWRGLVRFVMTVDVHPGPGKQRSTAKPAAGEMNGPAPPRPRDDMDGVHEASTRPSAATRKPGAKPPAAEGPAPGALAKPSGAGPRKPAPKRRREQLAKQRAQARGAPEDEREATAGVGRADVEAHAPSGEEDEAAAVREREARVRATGLSVTETAPAQLPAARAYAARIQADLAALQQSRMAGGRPVAPRAGWFVGEDGGVVTLDARNRGGGGAAAGGLKGGARGRGGQDEVVLHDEREEEERSVEPAGEALDPDESISEDDAEELAAEEELMYEARPEELEDAPDLDVPVAERVHLEEQYAAAERHLATLIYLVPSRPDVHAQAREALDAARRALEQRGLRVPGSEREEHVEAGDEEAAEEEAGVNAHDAAYLEARKRAKLDNADQAKLLKWHPHYHVSVTFTKMSGVATPDLGALKAELQNRGLKDVNIKRSYKPGINNWNKIERYPLVTANDPLVHRFLLAVGHERVSVNGEDVGPEYEYPERLEANVLHHRMRSAIEYTNRDVLSHVPDYYKRLENYYYALRTASTNASGEREIPSLSDYFDNARAHDLNSLEAISQPLSERTSYVKQLQDFMRRENLKVKRVGKGEKDFAVYASLLYLTWHAAPCTKWVLVDGLATPQCALLCGGPLRVGRAVSERESSVSRLTRTSLDMRPSRSSRPASATRSSSPPRMSSSAPISTPSTATSSIEACASSTRTFRAPVRASGRPLRRSSRAPSTPATPSVRTRRTMMPPSSNAPRRPCCPRSSRASAGWRLARAGSSSVTTRTTPTRTTRASVCATCASIAVHTDATLPASTAPSTSIFPCGSRCLCSRTGPPRWATTLALRTSCAGPRRSSIAGPPIATTWLARSTRTASTSTRCPRRAKRR